MKTPALFNPQPAAQANRRSADFFERCRATRRSRTDQTRNDTPADINPAALFPLLCEARLNDKTPTSPMCAGSISSALLRAAQFQLANFRDTFFSVVRVIHNQHLQVCRFPSGIARRNDCRFVDQIAGRDSGLRSDTRRQVRKCRTWHLADTEDVPREAGA